MTALKQEGADKPKTNAIKKEFGLIIAEELISKTCTFIKFKKKILRDQK